MPTEVKVRGATQATQEARTLSSRELDINLTDKRISVHDGTTAGGIPHANCFDIQNNEWTYAAASGTNTITITLAKAPAAYQEGQTFKFKAAATNTGSATFNVNSLGALTLKKKSIGVGIVALAAGDIISGGIYTIHVLDGSNALVEAVDGGSLVSVSQGDLNTSIGSVSTISTSPTFLTLPGGEYGFYPQVRGTNANIVTATICNLNNTTSFVTAINLSQSGGSTAYAQQRYVTSSPPYDLGDGECAGFIFLLLNDDGSISSTYSAESPPWVHNGPTNTRAVKKCRITGKKYCLAKRERTLEEILDGVGESTELTEITHARKNKDMSVIPHPFNGAKGRVVLLDTMDEKVRRLIEAQNAGEDITSAFHSGLLYADNEPLERKGPEGIMQSRLIFKRS